MDKESFRLTNRRVVGEARPIVDSEGQAAFSDTGSTVVVVMYYKDETKQEPERLCLYNLGPGVALINQISLRRGDRGILTDLFELLQPGEETLWFNVELLEAWVKAFTVEQQGILGAMTGAAGQWDFDVTVRLTAHGLRGSRWPIRLTRQYGGESDEYRILDPSNTGTLNY